MPEPPAHPQHQSLYALIPEATATHSPLHRWIARCVEESGAKARGLLFEAVTADHDGWDKVAPGDRHQVAQRSGTDVRVGLLGRFNICGRPTAIRLGDVPVPDEAGEFVLAGRRVVVPLLLRPTAPPPTSSARPNPGRQVPMAERMVRRLARTRLGTPARRPWEQAGWRDFADVDKWLSGAWNEGASSSTAPGPWRTAETLAVVLIGDVLQCEWVPVLARALTLAARVLGQMSAPTQTGDLARVWVRGTLTNVLEVATKQVFREYARPFDTDHPIARLSARRTATFLLPGGVHPESAGNLSLRDVDGTGDRGRLCPIESPQGQPIGLTLHLARGATVDPTTRRLTPPDPTRGADLLGHAASLIPFICHNDGSRALMAANMLKQTLRPAVPDEPLVQTGWERELVDRKLVPDDWQKNGVLAVGVNLRAAYLPWGLDTYEDGIVVSRSAATRLEAVGEETYWLDEVVAWQEPTADRPAGYRTVRIDTGWSPSEWPPGRQVSVGDVLIPARMWFAADEGGKKGTYIAPLTGPAEGEPADAAVRFDPGGNYAGEVVKVFDSNAEPDLFRLPPGVRRRVGVRVGWRVPLEVGDKLAGRHGNKGVVTNIVDDEQMPYTRAADGSPQLAEILLNPLGVLGRKNVGQLYETALGKAAQKVGRPVVVPPFPEEDGPPANAPDAGRWTPDRLASALRGAGFPDDGKEKMYLSRDGREAPLDQPVLVGPQYILRLHQLAGEKVAARSTGTYTPLDQQPPAGRRSDGGQRVGEMEAWALAGYQAWAVLDELFTRHSDDPVRRNHDNTDPAPARRPRGLVNLLFVLRSLGFNPRLLAPGDDDVTEPFLSSVAGAAFSEFRMGFATPEVSSGWFAGPVTETKRLIDEDLFGKPTEEFNDRMGYIELAAPVPHPLAAERERTRLRKGLARASNAESGRPRLPLDWRVALAEEFDKSRQNLLLRRLPVPPARFRMEPLDPTSRKPDAFPSGLNRLYADVLVANRRLAAVPTDRRLHQVLAKRVAAVFLGGRDRGGRYIPGLLEQLAGKGGLFRGRLAGKRVDYSGRAVIVGDRTLELDETRLPAVVWDKLFGTDATGTRVVLLNRQPSLHRYSVQAFRASRSPDPSETVIRISPFVCQGFNADFDGDTMAVYAPRSDRAVRDSELLQPSRLLWSQASGQLVLGTGGDIAVAAGYLSYAPGVESDDPVPPAEDLERRDWFTRTQLATGVTTTVGRRRLAAVFADLRTDPTESIPVPNRHLDRGRWTELVAAVARLGQAAIVSFVRRVSDLFAAVLDRSGLSVSIADVRSDPEPAADGPPPFLWLARMAGAKGDASPVRNAAARKLRRPTGEPVGKDGVVDTTLLEGHTPADFLLTMHDARAGLIDKGLNTAPAGALTRRLVYLAHRWRITRRDCGTTDGIPVPAERHADVGAIQAGGRSVTDDGKELRVRSPFTCGDRDTSNGCCAVCYGPDPATAQPPAVGLPVGLLAAQAVGERGTQLTLKTFHGGGKVVNLPELRRQLLSPPPPDLTNVYEKLADLRGFFGNDKGVLWREDPGEPRHVHFEVLLAARRLTPSKASRSVSDALARLAFGDVGRRMLAAAESGWKDDLRGVISRILTLMTPTPESTDERA
jgi:hypothetical protein